MVDDEWADVVRMLKAELDERGDATVELHSADVRRLSQVPGVAQTLDPDHIGRHEGLTHEWISPTGIVPRGPERDLTRPHGRG